CPLCRSPLRSVRSGFIRFGGFASVVGHRAFLLVGVCAACCRGAPAGLPSDMLTDLRHSRSQVLWFFATGTARSIETRRARDHVRRGNSVQWPALFSDRYGKGSESLMSRFLTLSAVAGCIIAVAAIGRAGEWPQLQGDQQRTGNAEYESLQAPLGLIAALPCTDAVIAAPIVSDGKLVVIDGAGVVSAYDVQSHEKLWTFATPGGAGNCNNIAAPAAVGKFIHVGTMAGYYFVLDRDTGEVLTQIDRAEPIFAAPVVARDRVYFATLGARLFALQADGTQVWEWDFVREVIGFEGDRWKGEDWTAFRGDRVTWKDHFVCSRDLCAVDGAIVMPSGGRTVFIEDAGDAPRLRTIGVIPDFHGKEFPATFGQSADAEGNVYVQWHRRDNAGRLEVLRLDGDELQITSVPGTETYINQPDLLGFASV